MRLRLHHVAIPILALLAIGPLLIHGCSCGHDQPFHVQSWLEAAQQFRKGVFYPRWAFSPAWQAGEPRFIFYPPLSWFLGALLTMVFPMNAVPVVFTWIALTGAGFSMHHLARRFASPELALLCASFYLANPYMLFNAFERGAYAELLAAVWIPLVLLSVLENKLSVLRIAIPLALVWLTNAPAGVMATYTVCLLGIARLVLVHRQARSELRRRKAVWWSLATLAGGGALGFGLIGFYLLPAAYERRYVQVAMAIIPNLRYQDNFLFSKTDYAPHNEITHTVSVLALVLLLATFLVVVFGICSWKKADERPAGQESFARSISARLLLLTCVIGLLLVPASSFLWEHVPNLKFLQFPWRLCTVLSAVLAFSLVGAFDRFLFRKVGMWAACIVCVLALSQLCSHLYRQGCETNDYPAFAAEAFRTGHGVLPTDEYTPEDADNDVQRTDEPGYWLVQGDANQPAPGTVPNPNETIVNYDGPIPFSQTLAERAPQHLALTLPSTETLVLNQRDYPAWQTFRNGAIVSQRVHRDDGLLAIQLPAGPSIIDVRWHRTWDQNAGAAMSICSLGVLGFLLWPSRKMKVQS